MKILATSDLHGNLDAINLTNIDIALFAGDIAPLRNITSWDVYDQLKWVNTKFKNWCESWPNTKIVFTPGNHDFFPIIKERYEYKLHSKKLDVNLTTNATMLIDSSIDINNIKIYGTPWVPIISHRWAFEAEHDKLDQKFSLIPEDIDILLTHTPPRFNNIDLSLQYGLDSEKFGSHELANAIFAKKPKLCFCGHIHSGDHEMNRLGSTKIWNVSRVNESYDITYEPIVMEV